MPLPISCLATWPRSLLEIDPLRKTQNIVAEWICNLNAGSMGVQGTQELFRIQGLGALPISVRCVALKASQNKSGVQT